jgi:hypothetical protein
MKKRLFWLAALWLAAANASACSVPAYTLDQQVEKAEEIFIATLIEAKYMPSDGSGEPPRVEGRFRTKKILKGGTQPKELTLTTALGRSDCGIGMMVSWKYIIFKGRKETGIGAPSGTRLIEDFQENELAGEIQSIVRRQKDKAKRK